MIPNKWVRLVYWFAVTFGVTAYLWARLPGLKLGVSSPADAVAMVVWLALILIPIFPEVELFGVKLKAQIEELKSDIRRDLSEVRAEVRSAIDVRTTVNPVFNLLPAPDQQLASLKSLVQQEIANHRITPSLAGTGQVTPPSVAPEISELFALRYNLEQELSRIGEARLGTTQSGRRPVPATSLIRGLADAGLLSSDLAQAMRELYTIATAAIHGRQPTQEQLGFVRELGPTALAALKAL